MSYDTPSACRLAQATPWVSCVPTTFRPEWATEAFHMNIIGSRAGGDGERRRYAHAFAMDNVADVREKWKELLRKNDPFFGAGFAGGVTTASGGLSCGIGRE